MKRGWTKHRIVVEVAVDGVTESDVRWAVHQLVAGDKLHREINRVPPYRPTGHVYVKMWSKAKRWILKETTSGKD